MELEGGRKVILTCSGLCGVGADLAVVVCIFSLINTVREKHKLDWRDYFISTTSSQQSQSVMSYSRVRSMIQGLRGEEQADLEDRGRGYPDKLRMRYRGRWLHQGI